MPFILFSLLVLPMPLALAARTGRRFAELVPLVLGGRVGRGLPAGACGRTVPGPLAVPGRGGGRLDLSGGAVCRAARRERPDRVCPGASSAGRDRVLWCAGPALVDLPGPVFYRLGRGSPTGVWPSKAYCWRTSFPALPAFMRDSRSTRRRLLCSSISCSRPPGWGCGKMRRFLPRTFWH